ncbi:MAG: hypothetical protein H5T71_00195 [Chloroflexi bacterium]|nr:hypothetical protein [Chloroflexota bacterium]
MKKDVLKERLYVLQLLVEKLIPHVQGLEGLIALKLLVEELENIRKEVA